jgi:geranylgeranyl diphosphate synthase, type II
LLGSLRDHLKPRQQATEAALIQALDKHLSTAPDRLVEALRYSLTAPGKRLRPMLVMLAAEAVGSTYQTACSAAVAVEMVHTYSLIHDDLPAMDDDDLRRGLPTSHVKFGEALAILAGDCLLTMAFEVLTEGYPGQTAAVLIREMAYGIGGCGMVGGQVLDLMAEGRLPDSPTLSTDVETLQRIHRAKTGLLIRASLRMGVLLAGSEGAKTLPMIDQYAEALGLAFQITDDLLDVESSAEKTGKRVNKDAARGKMTYPALLGVAGSRNKAKELVAQACSAASQLGPKAEPLAELAKYVLERDR